jgi:hypothetical protein
MVVRCCVRVSAGASTRLASSASLPGLAHLGQARQVAVRISGTATLRTRSLSASATMYSTGDLPSTRASNKRRQQPCHACLQILRRLP